VLWILLLSHVLFGKPVSTFPGHALSRVFAANLRDGSRYRWRTLFAAPATRCAKQKRRIKKTNGRDKPGHGDIVKQLKVC
jgi:hypothetical protein